MQDFGTSFNEFIAKIDPYVLVAVISGLYSAVTIFLIVMAKKKDWQVRINPIFTLIMLFVFILSIIGFATGSNLTEILASLQSS
jgi:hypothetical protein